MCIRDRFYKFDKNTPLNWLDPGGFLGVTSASCVILDDVAVHAHRSWWRHDNRRFPVTKHAGMTRQISWRRRWQLSQLTALTIFGDTIVTGFPQYDAKTNSQFVIVLWSCWLFPLKMLRHIYIVCRKTCQHIGSYGICRIALIRTCWRQSAVCCLLNTNSVVVRRRLLGKVCRLRIAL